MTVGTTGRSEHRPLRGRLRAEPRPAAVWLLGVCVLLGLELGRIGPGLAGLVGGAAAASAAATAWLDGGLAGGGLQQASVIIALVAAGTGLAALSERSVTRRLLDRARPRRQEGQTGWAQIRGEIQRVIQRQRPLPLWLQTLSDGAVAAVVLVVVGWLGLRTGLFGLLGAATDLAQSALRLPGGLPTITSRELIPNQGYQTPDGDWHGTFRGLSPALAWGVRVAVVFAYVAAWLGWLGLGTRWYRRRYRRADWTPRDDVLRRLRGHRWGQFGLLVVAVFLTMALFAPALGTASADQAIYSPFSNSIAYYDADSGAVSDIRVGQANLQTRSEGFPDRNVGPLSYDQYDRFHPFGTMTDGKDLFTFLVHGARVSLVIGLLSVGVSTVLATVFALVSAYYRGIADLVLVVTGDTIMGVPRLLLLILLTVLLSDTWLAELYDGGVLLALVLAGTGWPFLWRSFRGPALQVAEEDWVDAARSYGQSAGGIMRLHVLPYLVGYLLIYSSLVLGGVILAIAGLSFLGLGITAPTPEWGRAVDLGREYVATESWHISLIPGLMITLVVMGFNAVGDALRDAVDPQSDAGVGDAGDAESRGGGA